MSRFCRSERNLQIPQHAGRIRGQIAVERIGAFGHLRMHDLHAHRQQVVVIEMPMALPTLRIRLTSADRRCGDAPAAWRTPPDSSARTQAHADALDEGRDDQPPGAMSGVQRDISNIDHSRSTRPPPSHIVDRIAREPAGEHHRDHRADAARRHQQPVSVTE
jgi:hypothetical protein